MCSHACMLNYFYVYVYLCMCICVCVCVCVSVRMHLLCILYIALYHPSYIVHQSTVVCVQFPIALASCCYVMSC